MHSHRFFLRFYVSLMYTSACVCEGVYGVCVCMVSVCVCQCTFMRDCDCNCECDCVCVGVSDWIPFCSTQSLLNTRWGAFAFLLPFSSMFNSRLDACWLGTTSPTSRGWNCRHRQDFRRTCALAHSNWKRSHTRSASALPPEGGLLEAEA